jgi:hypothetical protein
MHISQKLSHLVVATLLCVTDDFVLTPFDDDGHVSNRTRSTRSVRSESDHHDLVMLHEPDHGSALPELAAAIGLVVAPAVAVVSTPARASDFEIALASGEFIRPLPAGGPRSRPASPAASRGPPSA